jgi:hypothetical protein
MMFQVGQKVVCVDASLPANPWHCQHPLIDRQIYEVQALAGPHYIDIDGSGRAWQNWRFRPLVERKTDISVFTEILRKAGKSAKAPARSKHLTDTISAADTEYCAMLSTKEEWQ